MQPLLSFLPGNAKAWAFQSETPLTGAVLTIMADTLNAFVAGWQSHGTPVRGGWQVVDGHFLIVAAEEGPSGCSTDGLMRTIGAIEQSAGVNLRDRRLACLRSEDGTIRFAPIAEVRKGNMPADVETLRYYDLSLDRLADFRDDWPVLLTQSWLAPKKDTV